MEERNDHDLLLSFRAEMTERVGNLTKSQDAFHQEVKQNFIDLRENYSGRIDGHEIRLVNLEKFKISQTTAMLIYIGIGCFIVTLLVMHIMKTI